MTGFLSQRELINRCFKQGNNCFYHATFRKYMSDIRKNGLVCNNTHRNWECEDGLYFGLDINICASFCDAAEDVPEEVFDSGIVVLAIPIIRLDLRLLFLDPNNLDNYDASLKDDLNHYTLRYTGNISPNNLGIVQFKPEIKLISLKDVQRVTDKYLWS